MRDGEKDILPFASAGEGPHFFLTVRQRAMKLPIGLLGNMATGLGYRLDAGSRGWRASVGGRLLVLLGRVGHRRHGKRHLQGRRKSSGVEMETAGIKAGAMVLGDHWPIVRNDSAAITEDFAVVDEERSVGSVVPEMLGNVRVGVALAGSMFGGLIMIITNWRVGALVNEGSRFVGDAHGGSRRRPR